MPRPASPPPIDLGPYRGPPRPARRPALRWLALALATAATLPLGTRPAAAARQDQQAVAEATGSGPLETTIVVEKLRLERGPGEQEYRSWVPAQRLKSGDEVHYTVRVRNPGKDPVTGIVVTKRLPFGVRYEVDSASGPSCEVQLSMDGGKSFAVPHPAAAAGSKAARGSRRTAPPVEYTHVRWLLSQPLAPGATALLRFRATFS